MEKTHNSLSSSVFQKLRMDIGFILSMKNFLLFSLFLWLLDFLFLFNKDNKK